MNALTLTVVIGTVASGLPAGALKALHRQYPQFAKAAPGQVIAADFDHNGRTDWVTLVKTQNGRWAILAAYSMDDGWRAGNIDMGEGPEAPDRLEVLAAGAYERHRSCTGALKPNERQSFSSPLPGVIAGSSGWRRAYQLGPHAWGFVCIGSETP